jgi:hypothetical protein
MVSNKKLALRRAMSRIALRLDVAHLPRRKQLNSGLFSRLAKCGDVAMYEELRRHKRIGLRTELWIGQDGIFTRTDERLRDLSIGGAYIESRQIYPVGAVISIRFKIPAATNLVSCSAIVRNAQMGDGFGVQFLDISRENVHLIERQVGGDSPMAQARF